MKKLLRLLCIAILALFLVFHFLCYPAYAFADYISDRNAYNLKEYYEYILTHPELPNDFITWHMLQNLGSLKRVTFSTDNRTFYYVTIDENDMYCELVISHDSKLHAAAYPEQPVYDAPDDLESMAYIDKEVPDPYYRVVKGDLNYYYYGTGDLYLIDWCLGENTVFSISFTANWKPSEYPMDGKNTFMKQLLSADENEANWAVDRLHMRIYLLRIHPYVTGCMVIALVVLSVYRLRKKQIEQNASKFSCE